MSGLPVTDPALEPVRGGGHSPKHRRGLLVRRTILSVLILGLSVWLAGAAAAPTSGPIERVLMLVIALLLPLHLLFWQLGGIKLLDRARKLPKPLAIVVAYTALGSSPIVLYPLGLIAVLVAIFSGGGAAAPALTVTGLLMLSPIIAIVLIALMFMLSSHK